MFFWDQEQISDRFSLSQLLFVPNAHHLTDVPQHNDNIIVLKFRNCEWESYLCKSTLFMTANWQGVAMLWSFINILRLSNPSPFWQKNRQIDFVVTRLCLSVCLEKTVTTSLYPLKIFCCTYLIVNFSKTGLGSITNQHITMNIKIYGNQLRGGGWVVL